MRFSRSTHLLMCLSLETLTSIIRTGLPIAVELIDLVNSVKIFLSQMTFLRWLTFLLRSLSHSPALLDFFLSSDTSNCSTRALPPLENLIMLLPWFPLTFQQAQNGMPCFIVWLMAILVLIGTVFVII